MAFNFPSNPTAGQIYGNYTYNATTNAWDIISFSDGIPAGVIMAWGASSAPANWLICDGSAISRSTYASLFNAIGTTYGTGDGSTTFNLPDLRGRVIVGKNGATFGTLGATGGVESVTLTANQSGLRDHTHVLRLGTNTGANDGNDMAARSSASGGLDPNFRTGLAKGTNSTLGSNYYGSSDITKDAIDAHTNIQPYQVANYIIKYSAANTPGDSELATRVGALEYADSLTNKSGLVPIVPSSVSVSSGSASVGANGIITVTGATLATITDCFSSSYRNYKVLITITAAGSNTMHSRLRNGSGQSSSNYAGRYMSFSAATGTTITTAFDMVGYNTNDFIDATISQPFLAMQTYCQVNGMQGGSTAYFTSCSNSNQTSYNSLDLLKGNGEAWSGIVQVYGYR